jgi:cytochrome c peroxidase
MRAVSGVIAAVALSAIGTVANLPSARLIAADAVRRPLGLDLYCPNPDENPLTRAKIDLGRRLFRDKRLSSDGSMACASCHDPARAFTNGETVARGVSGRRGTRNVPTIVNRAWGRSFFWDGRAPTLEDQVLQPILHADELAMTAARVVALATSDRYQQRFTAAFGVRSDASAPDGGRGLTSGSRAGERSLADAALGLSRTLSSSAGAPGRQPDPPVRSEAQRQREASGGVDNPYDGLTASDAWTLRQVALALAAYVRTIQAGASPYDRYITGRRDALTAEARRGLDIFRGKGGCTGCHVGPTFSDEAFHNTGVAWRTGVLTDEGRARVTRAAADRGAFKTPTLREVARTAPYMHDGSFATLAEVVAFYNRGGAPNPGLDSQLRPLALTPVEQQDLVGFLRSLNGRRRDGE